MRKPPLSSPIVLDYRRPARRKPPKMWPIRAAGVLGVIFSPIYAAAVLRDPGRHDKALDVFGMALIFVAGCFELTVKPRMSTRDDIDAGALPPSPARTADVAPDASH